ncbi:ABC transporter ATP-binding protein [Niallia circulans]|uniref:ABC transporter ATP-binding protein n=1 Tax=Niallia circulans TaxID=1397 RepID=A0A553SHR0_NIACI|nr:ABC transporter ATP-binding protein [Niallia circulans]TRZ36521.1 ABC transporter ATP-binding protein [Niallia circulans]
MSSLSTQSEQQHKQAANGMKRMWELAFTKKALVVTSCILSVVSVAVSFIPFLSIYYIIRELAYNLSDLSIINGSYIIKLGWLAGGSAVGAILLNFIALMCSHLAAFQTLYNLKLAFVNHLASLPLGFYTQNSTGKLRKVVDENIEKIEGFIAHQLPDIIGSFATPIVVLIILLGFDWRLGLATLFPIISLYVIQALYMGKKSSEFMKIYQDSLEDMNNQSVEYIRGISVIKAFGQTIYSFRKFYTSIKSYGDFALAYTKAYKNAYLLFLVILNNIYIFLIPVVIWISTDITDYPRFSMAVLFYLIFSVAITTPFLKLMYVSQTGRQIADGIERMDKIFQEKPLPESQNPEKTTNFNISFENVSFSYEDSEALSDISFIAKQNEVTALVGPSGSGKSTIAHLIPRFYDVSKGSIKIGGVNIKKMSTDYLMSIVSFVFQDVFLFQQSILENIMIGNKSASRTEVIAAAKAAQCHEFIEKMPNGYDTVIGASNIQLSGGEKQRIAIARAILKDAPIIVLDEATAFADPENEHKVQLAFEKLMKNKTVILIAHRLSTVKGSDNILVINEGKLMEEGKHDTLISLGGRYRHMWDQYTSAMSWTIAEERQVQNNA